MSDLSSNESTRGENMQRKSVEVNSHHSSSAGFQALLGGPREGVVREIQPSEEAERRPSPRNFHGSLAEITMC